MIGSAVGFAVLLAIEYALAAFAGGCGFGLWWWCIGIIDEGRAGEADR
jgi:hypothetical protein